MTATITTAARAAADRARDLADIVAARATLSSDRDAILKIASLLITAAEGLETTDAPVMDGITITNTTPAETVFALFEAQGIAEENPLAGIPGHVMWYVTAPITRRVPELEPLNPVSAQLARQETSLRADIAQAAVELKAATAPETRRVVLAAVLNLHRRFDRLAAFVAVDNNRPCNRR